MKNKENNQPMIELFARRLRQSMEVAGVKAIELAEITDISKSMISMYMNAKTEPGQTNILKISKALGVSPSWLIGSDEADGFLDKLKNDPELRMVAKISGTLSDEGKKDLLRYANLLNNQRDQSDDE